MGLHIHATWRPAVNMVGVLVLAIGSFVALILAYSIGNHSAEAATPPPTCFDFSAGTILEYYTNENNDPEQDACPTSVDVPETIGGVTVTVIGSNAFMGSGVTSLTFPTSLTTIQANAFTGLTLSTLSFNSTGDLAFNHQAFDGATLSLTDLNITVGGDLSIFNSLNGLALPGALTLHAAGDVLVTDGSLIAVTVGSLSIGSTGGDVTVANGSFGGNSSIASTVAISAADAIELSSGAFEGLQNANSAGISVNAGGNIQMVNGGLSSVNLGGPLTIASGGTIYMMGGVLSTVTVPSIAIQADDSVTIDGNGVINGVIPSGVSIDAGGNVSLLGAVISGTGISGKLIVRSGGSILLDNAVPGHSFTSVELLANSGIAIRTSALNTNPVLTDLTFATQTGLIDIAGHTFVSNGALEQISITAPQGLVISDALYNIGSPDVTIDVSGDVLIDDGSFVNAELDSLDIDTDGSITIGTDAFGGIAFIRNVDWRASEDLTIADDTRLNTWSMLYTESIRLHAGRDLSVGDRAFSTAKTTILDLSAGNTASFGDGVLGSLQLTELSLPSTTTHIGEEAFSYSKIQSVYLNGSTPVIDAGAFRYAGVSTDIDDGWSDFDQVHYVQLYTDSESLNPGGYVSTAYSFNNGGYIVNPATYTVNYLSNNGDALAPSFVSGTGPTLSDYLVSSNPTGDFSLYYQAGDNIPLTAPDIDEYITPVAHTLALAAGLNVYTFAYQTAAANENGVLSDTGSNQTVVLIVSLLALSAIGAAVIVKKTL